MAFDAPVITLAGLAKFELPAGKTIKLCDGGVVWFEGEKYLSIDEEFGTIGGVDGFEERIGDEAPGGSLTFLPESTAAAATLSQPGYQNSRIRFWLVQVDEATALADAGSAELIADMRLDTTSLRVGAGSRRLDIGMISTAERLFSINEGNVLSSRHHQSIFPGELGFDNAQGLDGTVAWGAPSPPRGSSAGGGGGLSGTNINQIIRRIF